MARLGMISRWFSVRVKEWCLKIVPKGCTSKCESDSRMQIILMNYDIFLTEPN